MDVEYAFRKISAEWYNFSRKIILTNVPLGVVDLSSKKTDNNVSQIAHAAANLDSIEFTPV